jgi:hypothetical protein
MNRLRNNNKKSASQNTLPKSCFLSHGTHLSMMIFF